MGNWKMVFVSQFIQHLAMVDPVPEKIIYCYGEYLEELQEFKDVVDGFPDMDKCVGGKKRLVGW